MSHAVPATTTRPTQALLDEHRVIETVLGALERLADRAFAKGELDTALARDCVRFIREYADRCHHGKEEERLFPAMEACGLPSEVGPTAVMRAEHEIGRAHVRRMETAAEDHERGRAGAAERFAHDARGFADMLHDHIAKEDQVLFPMADRMLPPPARDALLRSYADFETKEFGPGAQERYRELARSIVERSLANA